MAQTTLALARMLDNPRAVSAQPAAARQLTVILAWLARSSHRRAKLAVVKSMTEKGGVVEQPVHRCGRRHSATVVGDGGTAHGGQVKAEINARRKERGWT